MASKVLSGGSKLQAHLKRLSKAVSTAASVRVGFLEGSTTTGGVSLPMVAAVQEFGAPAKGIPPRPYFRTMIKKEEGHWGRDLGLLLRANQYDAKKALGQMGDEIKGELQQSIVDLTDPPLSQVTLLLRERFGNHPEDITFGDVSQARHDIASGKVPNVSGTQAKPLIWTGNMLNSVDKEVI